MHIIIIYCIVYALVKTFDRAYKLSARKINVARVLHAVIEISIGKIIKNNQESKTINYNNIVVRNALPAK